MTKALTQADVLRALASALDASDAAMPYAGKAPRKRHVQFSDREAGRQRDQARKRARHVKEGYLDMVSLRDVARDF